MQTKKKTKTYLLVLLSLFILAFSASVATKSLQNNTRLLKEIASKQLRLSYYSNQLNKEIQINQANILEALIAKDTNAIKTIQQSSDNIVNTLKKLSLCIQKHKTTLPEKVFTINKIIDKRIVAYKSVEDSILRAIKTNDQQSYKDALIGFNSTSAAFTNDVLKLVEMINEMLKKKIQALQMQNERTNFIIYVSFIAIALLLLVSIYLTFRYQNKMFTQLKRAEEAEKQTKFLSKQLEKYSKELEDEVKKKTQELRTNLYTNIISKLPNRNKLLLDIEENYIRYLVIFNIDNFQKFNDVYGEQIGNEALRLTGDFLKNTIPSSLHLYHIGGDEFVVVADKETTISKEQFVNTVELTLKSYRKHPFLFEQNELFLSMSAGIAFDGLQKILAYADMALKNAKKEGKNYDIYQNQNLEAQHKEDIDCYKKLLNALEHNRIIPYLQPIVPLNDKSLPVKYEALARLIDENSQVIVPTYFLQVAKQNRIYHKITYKIIDYVLSVIEEYRLPISINLSMMDITNEKTVKTIYEKLHNFKHCELLTFELLETEDFEDYKSVYDFCVEVKRFGVSLSLDDFGSGYSNFAHIIHLPIDFIKIDASLISNITRDFSSKLMVETIVDLSKKIGAKTIAEYVSSEEILKTVRELHVDYAQGFFTGKPKEVGEYIQSPPSLV